MLVPSSKADKQPQRALAALKEGLVGSMGFVLGINFFFFARKRTVAGANPFEDHDYTPLAALLQLLANVAIFGALGFLLDLGLSKSSGGKKRSSFLLREAKRVLRIVAQVLASAIVLPPAFAANALIKSSVKGLLETFFSSTGRCGFLGGAEWTVRTGNSVAHFASIGAYALILSALCSVAAMLVQAYLDDHTDKHSKTLADAKARGHDAKKHSTTTRKVIFYHELSQVSIIDLEVLFLCP